MKSCITFFVALLFVCTHISAQTPNAFPLTGKVGIGTTTPAAKLHVLENSRDYYVNRGVSGITEDGLGVNYMLLHQIYTGTLLADRYVIGKITGIRGSTSALNRKWTVEVNTSSAYNTNKGSMISYNEGSRLVTLIYGGVNYLALEIANASVMRDFSFTGYASNDALHR